MAIHKTPFFPHHGNTISICILHHSSTFTLAPGRSECDCKNGIFNLVLLIGIFRSSHDNALRWMPQDLTDDKSILVQVMAWCCQATSHYLSQCWLSFFPPYAVTRPQWVKTLHVTDVHYQDQWNINHGNTRIILCMHPANETQCYNVMSSLIGWAHPQKDSW